jgi:uncharacterized protein YmfQ (DUF2313 family)
MAPLPLTDAIRPFRAGLSRCGDRLWRQTVLLPDASGYVADAGAADLEIALAAGADALITDAGHAEVTVTLPATDNAMSALALAYRAQLQALLPLGEAWPRRPDAVLTQLLNAWAAEFERIHRGDRLIDEAMPGSALDLLSEWEAIAGLPDACGAEIDTTLEERRRTLVAMLTRRSRQSMSFWVAYAAMLGYEIGIEQFRPFVAGLSRCGHQLWGGPRVRYQWRIRIAGARYTPFRVGISRCGDRLGKISYANGLECRMRRYAQAHTTLIFSYGENA